MTSNRSTQGVLGEKLGMTQVFDEANRIVPVTVVKAGPCVVTQVRTADRDGYSAVQLAYGAIDPRKVNKPIAGHFAVAGVPPRRHLVEIRTPTRRRTPLARRSPLSCSLPAPESTSSAPARARATQVS